MRAEEFLLRAAGPSLEVSRRKFGAAWDREGVELDEL